MGKKHQQTTPFTLEGRFLGFGIEDGYKIKRLRLMTAAGEYELKLTKEARASVGKILTAGDWLQAWGEKTTHPDIHTTKLKIYKISVAAPRQTGTESAPTLSKVTSSSTTSILICQKSDCIKRGSKAVCAALEATLGDRGLTNQVTIRATGCMKNCKAGANLVVMPDKIRYSHITPSDVPELVEKHFSTLGITETSQPERLPVSV